MNSSPYARALLIFLALSVIAALTIYYFCPNVLLATLAGVNLGSFGLFAYDKAAASADSLRVPEFSLLLSALLGGSAGALFAIALLRHKSRKASFQAKLVLVLALQVVVFILLKQKS